MSIVTIKLEDVFLRPNARPRDKAEVEEIADSMRLLGWLPNEPLSVYREGDIYRIIDGGHRYEAAEIVGITDAPAIVSEVSDDGEVLTREGAANIHRPDTEEQRWARAQEMLMLGVTPQRIKVATKLTEDEQEVAKRVRERLHDDPAFQCITTFQWAAAVDAEGDDKQAVDAIMCAGEKDWRRVAEAFRQQRKAQEREDEQKAIIEASGCELIGVDHAGLYRYLGCFPTAPEGATHAQTSSHGVFWYGPLTESGQPDPEAEEKAKHQAEVEAAHIARLEFIGRHLSRTYGTDALTAYAFEAWHDRGLRCEERFIPEEWAIKGPTMFFHAAVLAYAETLATETQRGAWNADQKETDRYLAAMKAVGYEEEA